MSFLRHVESRPRLAFLLPVVALAVGQNACARAARPAEHAEVSIAASQAVSDEAFSNAVRDLVLSSPGGAERQTRLSSIEARQMTRAAARFKLRSEDRGVAAVTGALYLVREGDVFTYGPDGEAALRAAAHVVALRGDEGRARALYDLLLKVVPPSGQGEIREHVKAIDTWTNAIGADDGPVERAGALERIAVRRSLLDPSAAAKADAVRAVSEWIRRALVLRDAFRATRVQPAREEGAEAWRALEIGALVLASIFLRDANVRGAVAALDGSGVRELLAAERPQTLDALDAAAIDMNGARCSDVLSQLRMLSGRDQGRQDDDSEDDRALFGAAAISIASECFRVEPAAPQVAFTLAVAFGELGMAEVGPALMVQAFRAHPDPTVGSQALSLALGAMAAEEEAGDVGAARRVFNAAQPLLDEASSRTLTGKVHPSAARLRAVMGDIELREGNLDGARTLFRLSAAEEVEGGVLLSLARIERRDGRPADALEHLREALSSDDASHDPALRGEILLLVSDIACDRGDVVGARTPLTDALKDLVQSRNASDGDARARVERVLARVLDRFGAVQPAERALERAYAAAPGSRSQAAQTIELLIGRAFVRGDLAAARDGLQRAVTTDLDPDDLVYFALWVRLLERQLHVTTDGTADRVFASIPDDTRWVATLARFGESKLKGDELVDKAVTPIQRYEALFYAAMDRRASGDRKGGDDLLRQVVSGTGLELSEVSLARDILFPDHSQVGGLPQDLAVP